MSCHVSVRLRALRHLRPRLVGRARSSRDAHTTRRKACSTSAMRRRPPGGPPSPRRGSITVTLPLRGSYAHRRRGHCVQTGLAILDPATEDLHPRPERRRAVAFPHATPEHVGAGPAGVRRQLLGETGLADRRFTHEEREAPATGTRSIEGVVQRGELGVSADEPTCTERRHAARIIRRPKPDRRARVAGRVRSSRPGKCAGSRTGRARWRRGPSARKLASPPTSRTGKAVLCARLPAVASSSVATGRRRSRYE